MTEYQKIPGPFKRHTEGPVRNKVIPWDWSTDDLEALSHSDWHWTEKVDGTNIRVIWSGYTVEFGGRTDNAQIPAKLVKHLTETFTEELLEQKFGSTSAVLYGEGYGAGIQSGGLYRPDQSFILFDVRIGGWWLRPHDVTDVARSLGIPVVPTYGDDHLVQMIQIVAAGPLNSLVTKGAQAEGMVGVTRTGLLDRNGNRIMVKLKTKDLLGAL